METQLELAENLTFLEKNCLTPLLQECSEITRMLHALMGTLRGD